MFEIRDYSHRKYARLIDTECLLCYRKFKIPHNNIGRVTTCCDYCSFVMLGMKKTTGKYHQCKMCDKPVFITDRKRKTTKRIYCSRNCANLGWSIYHESKGTGKKYYGPNWLNQRRKCRKRDRYKCVDCDISEEEYGKEMSVHHIKPFVYFASYQQANKLENLVSVCEDCHRKRHSGEEHPSKFDMSLIVADTKPKVKIMQKQKAQKVYDLLITTDKTLAEISRETGLSYGGVSKIYHGRRWKELYVKPAKLTNPRRCTRD